MEFHHGKLVDRDFAEVKRFRQMVMEATPDRDVYNRIVHDGDCCRKERWEDTERRLVDAIRPDAARLVANHGLEGLPGRDE